MSGVSRRQLLISALALPAGCALHTSGGDAAASAGQKARPPAVGQSWHYATRDLYTGGILHDEVDSVAAVDRLILIDSSVGTGRGGRRPAGEQPGEVQGPWGMVSVDAHWSELQVYATPIPLWPKQLRPGWETRVSTKYTTPRNDHPLDWQQSISARAWETITVPAGRFTALRYTNFIRYASGEFERTGCTRQETLWFAPEVGRWVARESKGSYYVRGSVSDQAYLENAYRWELLAWS
jgi:hypothetical protein